MDPTTLQLTQALIARPSLTPDDAGCQDYLGAYLRALGFHLDAFTEGGVSNVWARRGDTPPVFVFAGHTDVVASGPLETWQSPPFTPVIRQGKLFGRGSADMKASLAAFITAIAEFLERHPQHHGSLGVLLTSDEEGEARHGTAAVVDRLKRRNETIDFCLIGEPTCSTVFGDTIKNGRRGSLSAHLTVYGKQGHIAYPDRADNPIHAMVPFLHQLTSTQWDHGTALFAPSSCQIFAIQSGTGAGNVIPGVSTLAFNFRFSPEQTVQTLQAKVSALLNAHPFRYTIAWRHYADPFLTQQGRLLDATVQAVREVTGITPAVNTEGGTSDGRFIAPFCKEVVEFGPLNSTIHQVDECVAVSDLPKLKAIYLKVLETLLTYTHPT